MSGPRGRGMRQTEKAKNFKGTIGKLIRYMKPYAFSRFVIVLFSAASTIFSIIGPRILGSATTKLAEGLMAKYTNQGGIDFEAIGKILLTLLMIYVLSALFTYGQGWMMAGITQKITSSLRKDISEKINRLPLSYFDRQTHGEVLSRVTNDVYTMSQSLNQSVLP